MLAVVEVRHGSPSSKRSQAECHAAEASAHVDQPHDLHSLKSSRSAHRELKRIFRIGTEIKPPITRADFNYLGLDGKVQQSRIRFEPTSADLSPLLASPQRSAAACNHG